MSEIHRIFCCTTTGCVYNKPDCIVYSSLSEMEKHQKDCQTCKNYMKNMFPEPSFKEKMLDKFMNFQINDVPKSVLLPGILVLFPVSMTIVSGYISYKMIKKFILK